jgi:quinol monooxygenase YgiN
MTAQTVIELRQYRMKPGRRDDLIALFEREFVESQEACGMSLLGQFRDLDAPGHFVWMRGFESMAARKAALEGFYGGLVWQAHREAAKSCCSSRRSPPPASTCRRASPTARTWARPP